MKNEMTTSTIEEDTRSVFVKLNDSHVSHGNNTQIRTPSRSDLVERSRVFFRSISESLKIDNKYRQLGINIEPEVSPHYYQQCERLKPFFRSLQNNLFIDFKYR